MVNRKSCELDINILRFFEKIFGMILWNEMQTLSDIWLCAEFSESGHASVGCTMEVEHPIFTFSLA